MAVAHDPMARLRLMALDGLAAPTMAAPVRKNRAAAASRSGPPMGPHGVAAATREVIPWVLADEAERWWHRCAHPWTPTLATLVDRGVLAVRLVRPGALEVDQRNGTQRARGVPRAWVPVVIALLTGRELVPVRKALAAGVRAFLPLGDRPGMARA